jgi:1,4-dihydroxy-2-naphthoate octaprenyltransferase
MKYVALYHLARIPPLTAWSVCGLVIAAAVAVYGYGISGVNWWFFGLVALAGVLVQYVAHPLNDLMDLEVDREAKIDETSRSKVLLNGMATPAELKILSVAIIAIVLGIVVYLSLALPLIPVFAAIGLVGLVGYNYWPLRLAYHPFAEWYLGIPTNMALVVAAVYAGTGTITLLAVLFGLIHAFAVGTFFVTMMSMDYFSDVRNGKVTTVGMFPRGKPCTFFAMAGLVVTVAAYWFYIGFAVIPPLNLVLFGTSLLIFGELTDLGGKADAFRHYALRADGGLDRFEEGTNLIRMEQLKIGILHAALISLFLIFGHLVAV